MTSSICHSGKGNTIEMVKRSVVARGLERERKGGISKAQGIFQSSETLLYDTVMVDAINTMHLSKTELHSTKCEPTVCN